MKKIVTALVIISSVLGCKNESGKGKFTLAGELKNANGQKIYFEELYFSDKAPSLLDTVEIKDGKFTVSAIAPEEGLYRLRTANGSNSYLFINDGTEMKFTGDINNPDLNSQNFSGSLNSALKKIMLYTDSVGRMISSKDRIINELMKAGAAGNDSTLMVLNNEYKTLTDNFTAYCFTYADTAKSPMLSLFAATMAPVELMKFQAPLQNLVKRFPEHKGIAGALAYINSQVAQQTQIQNSTPAQAAVGSMAPEITMNDVNGKPFSLSQLRGKYVLVDFWASWCGPCRDENPNIVAAYNQYKDKNFTILGVSLDENKSAWLEAIADDKLTWPQVSDLKRWSSDVVPAYGFDGIPYNVLIDPQGKIIATSLRGNALHDKLAEVLK